LEDGLINTNTEWTKRPKFRAIKAIIDSDEGQKTAMAAVDAGISPLCALDKLIREIIVGYSPAGYNTHDAGWIIADMMREMGYEEAGEAKCYDLESVAKSGKLWKMKI